VVTGILVDVFAVIISSSLQRPENRHKRSRDFKLSFMEDFVVVVTSVVVLWVVVDKLLSIIFSGL